VVPLLLNFHASLGIYLQGKANALKPDSYSSSTLLKLQTSWNNNMDLTQALWEELCSLEWKIHRVEMEGNQFLSCCKIKEALD
jgi:hypothetical protein